MNPANPCSCRRQVPIALAVGVIRQDELQHAGKPRSNKRRSLPLAPGTDLFRRAANVLCEHPDFAAPAALAGAIRDLLRSGRLVLQ